MERHYELTAALTADRLTDIRADWAGSFELESPAHSIARAA